MKILRNTRKYHGFTLVELIVVITILVILGTIAFISLGGYSLSARDSARISDITNITKALEITLLKNGSVIPPDKGDTGIITITASGTTIGYQGYAASNVLSNIKMSEAKDPLDKKYYTYLTNANYTKYQVLTLLENSSTLTQNNNFTPGIDTAFAGYETRIPSTKGSSLGVLLGNTGTTLNQPVQESYNVSSFTGVDVVNTATGYNAVFSKNDTVSGSGTKLFTNILNRTPELVNNKAFANLDANLVAYWDMETMNGALLKDVSGKGYDGTIVGGLSWNTKRRSSGVGTFDGTTGYISNPNVPLVSDAPLTISTWIRTPTPGVGQNPILKMNDSVAWDGYGLCITSSRFRLALLKTYGTVQLSLSSNTIIQADTWYFVTMTYDGSMAKIYVNGNLDISQAYTDGYDATTVPVYFARGFAFQGSLDEVRIYNRALSESEILSLYNATK